MRGWWIFLLPILYVPNIMGFNGATPLGVLELMDVAIVPLGLVLMFIKPTNRKDNDLKPYLKLRNFILWLIVGAIAFSFKFSYASNIPLLLTISKIGKFSMYVVFGYMIARRYKPEYYNKYIFSMVLIGVFMAYSSAFLKYEVDEVLAKILFSADNVLAVALGSLLSFLTMQAFYSASLSRTVKIITWASIPLMVLGLTLSDGRAAMGAYAISIFYLFMTKIYSAKIWFGVLFSVGCLLLFYVAQPDFKHNVDRTFNPSEEYLKKNKMDDHGFDDGKRLSGISNEFPKYWRNPIIGTGFFHRGYLTGLMAMGSHNYYFQMLLETGIVGFILIMGFFRYIWKKSNSRYNFEINMGMRLALITLFISCLTGEYLYASEALMMLLLLMVPFVYSKKELKIAPEK